MRNVVMKQMHLISHTGRDASLNNRGLISCFCPHEIITPETTRSILTQFEER